MKTSSAPPPDHTARVAPSVTAYKWHGCRCRACKTFYADYRRPRVIEYRARKRAERQEAS